MADSDGDGDGDGDGVGVWIKFLELDEQLTMVENEIEEQEEVIEDLRKEVREAKEEEARIPDEDDYRYGEDAEDDSDEEMDGDGSILNDLEQEHRDAGENLRERRKALKRALNSLTPLHDKQDSILDEYKQLQKKQMRIGSTAIGLKFREGVVLVAENRITVPARPLYQKSMMSIMDIDKHVGIAVTVTRSIAKNARKLVQEAQTLIQNHKVSNNGQPMAVDSMLQALSHRLANQIQPFVESLIASRDENGPPSLYYSDPSGVFYLCNAKAIGLQSEAADTHLEEHSNRVEDLTLENAENIALSILKQVMGEKVTPNNVGIAKVAPTYHPYTRSELEAVISRI